MSVSSLTGYLAPSSNPTFTNGLTVSTGNINCQAGEVQAATAQIGYNSTNGDIVLQVGNPAGNNVNFSISTDSGNPLAISTGLSASGELVAPSASIGQNSTTGDVVLQIGLPTGPYANLSISADAGNPLQISSAIQPTGLVDANGSIFN
jgi:hypothetical protein